MAEFYILLLENFPIFVALLLTNGAVLYFLFRKRISSFFDPIFYMIVITESFCITDVMFMALYDIIESRHFVQYMFSELALFAGILIIPRFEDKYANVEPVRSEFELLRVLFWLSLFLFLILNVFIYSVRGIPLLLDNRMAVYQDGGGLGFISRVLDVLLVIVFYYLLEVQRRFGWTWREWVCLGVIALIQVLSGAKSSVLTLVFIAALFVFISGPAAEGNEKLMRLIKRIFILAVGGFLLIAQVQVSDVEVGGRKLSVLDQAALRFINNGDAFLYAYPSNVVDSLDGSGSISAVLREYVAFLRVAPPDQIQTHLGLQLTRKFIASDSINQTNAKHNLFGYMNFGEIGGVIYSLVLGLIIGLVRETLFKKRAYSWLAGVPYIILNIGFLSAGSDLDNSSRAVLNVVFVFYPLVLAAYFLSSGARSVEPVR